MCYDNGALSMSVITPARLKIGDEIRVLAPARSMSIISEQNQTNALERLEKELGFKISFSSHCYESNNFLSSSIKSRVSDLHQAFADPQVKAILTVIGGYNSNQLLNYLDFDLIKNNPKILCGFSDITALSNAIFAKTSLINFCGPHFSTFACIKGMDYTIDYFKKCLMSHDSFKVLASDTYSDDEWYKEQDKREFLPNEGMKIIQAGKAQGQIIGGNLCTLNLLQGTSYMPDLNNKIIFLEDDALVFPEIFDRDLQSLIMQPGFDQVRGIVIGRFQKASNMSIFALTEICLGKKELQGLPIIANVDFGHTSPIITFPIGGQVHMDATGLKPYLSLSW